MAQVLDELRAVRALDADWRSGRLWNLVYHVDDAVGDLAARASGAFLADNGVSPLSFPSVARLQRDLIEFSASLLRAGPSPAGVVTSGGSESILLATLAARERARSRAPGGDPFDLILPTTAHPAWEKAAFYLGLRVVPVGVDRELRADVDAVRSVMTPRTALVVGSAPTYCHGVIDPIAELAEVASEHDACMHVDACLGGFLLPFAERLGYEVPPFDLSVAGVTSISADLHKYGFSPKGAGVLLYRNPGLRDLQYFVRTEWPGGIYATPTTSGSRSVSPIAAAWAVVRHLGIDGYQRIAGELLAASRRLVEGIRSIEGLGVQGDPAMTVFSVTSSCFDVHALVDALAARGWLLDRQQHPPAIHVSLTQLRHASLVDALLLDLRAVAAEARRSAAPAEPPARPSPAVLDDLVRGYLSSTLTPAPHADGGRAEAGLGYASPAPMRSTKLS